MQSKSEQIRALSYRRRSCRQSLTYLRCLVLVTFKVFVSALWAVGLNHRRDGTLRATRERQALPGLLKTVKDKADRQRIQKLLAEEQQKRKDAGDNIEE